MTLETKILRKLHGKQFALPELRLLINDSLKARAKRIADYLLVRKERAGRSCFICETKQGLKRLSYEVYDSPFNTKPTKTVYLCGEKCEETFLYDNYWDFKYQECTECNRFVIERCPSNGWHEYFRDSEDGRVCLQCYQEKILKEGISEDSFKAHELSGMFFQGGNPEPIQAGYSEVEGFSNYFVSSETGLKAYCDKALELIGRGFKVINAYEKLGLGGSEGYTTLMAKQ